MGTTNPLTHVLVQPDGKLLVGGIGSTTPSFSRYGLARLNADLSLDATFGTNSALTTAQIGTGALLRQPNGKIIVVGSTQTARYIP